MQPLLDAFSRRSRNPSYDLLPSSSTISPRSTSKDFSSPARYSRRLCCLSCTRRRLRTLFVALGLLGGLLVAATTYVLNYPLPPLYGRFHQAELALPQHDAGLPFPEGGNGRYLWVANHASKCGWGNAMQELFLNAYLAYRMDRSFVFDNYTWSRDEGDYSLYNLKPIPSRIPLTALISGPIAGGNFSSGLSVPRAVVPEYFYEVCKDRALIGSYEVSNALESPSAETLVQKWTDKMAPYRCVEIIRSPPELFDEHLFADAHRLLGIWPHFSRSPIVQAFSWSTLVELAFDNNRHIISPTSPFEPPLLASPTHGLARYDTIPGLLVLHIRRGDFKSHCFDVLARRGIGFTGFNSFPTLTDHWALPPDVSDRERRALYARRCFPDVTSIVDRVEQVRAEEERAGRILDKVYIMTNGSPKWAREPEGALRARNSWGHIASSRDLMLTPEQKYVSQALDMLVAQRAQVFIGNGFSTLSGMAVMLRMANGIPPAMTRHW